MVGQISSALTITIKKQAEDYTIEANGSKGIKVDPQLAPQLKALLSDQQITDTLKNLSSQTAPATTEAIQKLGKALYDSLFTDRDLLLAFGKVQGSTSSDSGARLRLQIEPIELAVLPWETLHDGQDWLSAQSITPLVRKLPLSNDRKPLQKLQVRGALRILFVGASPEGLDPLKVEETADELETLLAAPIKKKQIAFKKLLNVTLEELRQELLKDYHILYFAGHGSPEGIFLDDGQGDDIEKEGKVIGRERGDKSLVSAETLAQALKGKPTRLVFLAACETSKTSGGSRLLRGFAQELAERSNLPAIVAMQYFISDMQANPLTTQFFAALAAGRPIDVAMAEARSVLMKKGQVSRDVFSPVLYLQAEDGALFPKAKNWPVIGLGVALLMALIIGGGFARNAEIQSIRNLITSSQQSMSSNQTLDARVLSLQATKKLKKSFWQAMWPDTYLKNSVLYSLQDTVYSGQELNRLEAHRGKVSTVAFSPNGKLIVTGGDDATIRLWDTSGKMLHEFKGDTYGFERVIFTSDNKHILSLDGDGIVRLWDVSSAKLLHKFDVPGSSSEMAFSPDGQKIVSLGDDGFVGVWDISGKLLHKFKAYGEKERVSYSRSVAFSPDGRQIAIGKADKGSIDLWNISTGKLLHEFTELKDCFTKEPLSPGDVFCVTKVVFSPDGKKIAALGAQGSIIFVWDISGNLLNNFNKSEFEITDIVFSPDSQQIGMVSSENITWNKALKDELRQASNTLLNVFKGNNGLTISSVAFAPDGRLIAIGGEDGSVHLWDTVGQPLPKPQRLDSKQCGKFSNLVAMVGFSPDGRQIATGTEDGLVCLWDISGKLVGKIDRFKKDNFNGLGFTPDNKLLVALKNKNNSVISLVDSSGIPAIKFKNSDSRADTPPDKCNVYSFAFSHDGQRIATGGFYHDICLWDTSGKLLHKFKEGPLSEVPSIAFSPNGQLIVTAGVEGNALLWDISGKQLNQFAKEQRAVAGVAFSPDGQQIATGGGMKGQNVLLSDTSGKQWAKFNFEDVVPSVAFSQDGLEIATKADDGNIFLWRVALNIDQLLSMNCDWLRDYLKNNSKVSKSDRYLCDEIGSQK